MSEHRFTKKYANESTVGRLDQDGRVIVNTKEDGGGIHFGISLRPGTGRQLVHYSVWAYDEDDALEKIADYCRENNPEMVVSYNAVHQDMCRDIVREVEKNPEEYGFTEEQLENADDEDIVSDLIRNNLRKYRKLYNKAWINHDFDGMYTAVDFPRVLLRAEKISVKELPDD